MDDGSIRLLGIGIGNLQGTCRLRRRQCRTGPSGWVAPMLKLASIAT
jgi:hypothetical protein